MTATVDPLRPGWLTSTHDGGWDAGDLDRIPGLPPHTELIDGNLIFRSAQELFHFLAIDAIKSVSQRGVPSRVFTMRDGDQTALGGIHQPGFHAADAVLAVEAVSPRPRSRGDEAIPNLWLVNEVDGKTVVEVWKLDPRLGSSELVGEFVDDLDIEEPFPVTLDLREVDRRRR